MRAIGRGALVASIFAVVSVGGIGVGVGGCRGASDEQRPEAPRGGQLADRDVDEHACRQAGGSGTGSGSGSGSGNGDPWAAKPSDPNDPPDLGARHALADKTCPAVTAPFFYKIAKGSATSYILGTRHLGVPLSKFPASVRDRIGEAKLAVFEIAPGDNADVKFPDEDLANTLGPDLWKKYVALVGDATATQVEHGRPSTAMLMIMAMYEDITATLDDQVIHTVQDLKIPTTGLEKSEFQDRLLDNLLDDRMLRTLVTVTKDRDEVKQDSVDDLTQYCTGTDHEPGMDAKQRAQMLGAGYTPAELDHQDDVLVYDRNRDWIPKLIPMLDKGGVLIAVGADHLIGDKGVVALLTAKGYTVTRVAP